MRTEEEIRIRKAYLEGFADGKSCHSIEGGETIRAQIKILEWVLEDETKIPASGYVGIKDKENDR